MKTDKKFDVIVIGAGMGGLTSACLLAKKGYSVLVLEASHMPGGCSSSFYRKGYIFESGATTLIGFDEHQPLNKLEQMLDIKLPKEPINPPMTVHQNGKTITRWQDKEEWLSEAIKNFGEEQEQKRFWNLAYDVSDVVWKVSGKNNFFPPLDSTDWIKLLKNNPKDLWVLAYALKSVKKTAVETGISNPEFYRFLNEQLIISSQSMADETSFLFGAPAITYTNYTNFYVPGGLIEMAKTLQNYLSKHRGELITRQKVTGIEKNGSEFKLFTNKQKVFKSDVVLSNLPVWNMAELTQGSVSEYFRKESEKYDEAWGAFTMGIVTDDQFPEEFSLHHQIHIKEAEKTEGIDSNSLFVSLSKKGDRNRAKDGHRVMNVSVHSRTDQWFSSNGNYEDMKNNVQKRIVEILKDKLPYFSQAEIKLLFSSTPVSWSNWVYRKKGRVGGIPQSMSRSLLDWTPNKTPFDGLYLCGDTVFPGQGIPGVTLSGINVSYRIDKYLKNRR